MNIDVTWNLYTEYTPLYYTKIQGNLWYQQNFLGVC